MAPTTTAASQAPEQESADEGDAERHQRPLFDLLLEIEILLHHLDRVIDRALDLADHLVGRVLHVGAHLVRRTHHLALELVDLLGGVLPVGVYFPTDLICRLAHSWSSFNESMVSSGFNEAALIAFLPLRPRMAAISSKAAATMPAEIHISNDLFNR